MIKTIISRVLFLSFAFTVTFILPFTKKNCLHLYLELDNKKGQGLLWSVQEPEHTMIKREENIEFDRIHELEERLRRARNSRLNSFRNDPEADRNITQNISGK